MHLACPGVPRPVRQPPRSFAHQPALDGVRGIAVALVLLFHAGFGWMSGGYVGVSVFFTLSGYLITSLALVERERTGRLDARAFYARRVRRLLPASLACLAGVVAAGRPGCSATSSTCAATCGRRWPGLQLGRLAGGQSYAESSRRRPAGPARPLLVARHRGAVLLGVAVGAGRGAAPPAPRRRIVLVGVVTWPRRSLAPVDRQAVGRRRRVLGDAGPARRDPPRRPARRRAAPPAVALPRRLRGWPAPSGSSSSSPSPPRGRPARVPRTRAGCRSSRWRRWPCSLGLQVPSPCARALAWRPLVGLGVISYGVYLYHWPIYAVLDEQRTGLGRPAPCSPCGPP